MVSSFTGRSKLDIKKKFFMERIVKGIQLNKGRQYQLKVSKELKLFMVNIFSGLYQ